MANTRNQNTCPHCGGKVIIRQSIRESKLTKVLYGQCQNLACSWSGKGYLEWSFTLSPSAQPDPSINLPPTKYRSHPNIITHDVQSRSQHA